MKGVPNEVIFCDALSTDESQITYGKLRENPNEQFRLQCLQMRIESWLIGQCEEMTHGRSCPFPLAATTLVGISSLAEVFYKDCVAAEAGDGNRQLFCMFCGTLHQRLNRTLQKPFKESFVERWSVAKPDALTDVLYTYFRNSLLHGYYGKAVFITADETENVECDEAGFVRLNPFWLFEQFKKAARKHAADALQEEINGPLRRIALNYVCRLLDEE